MAETAAADRAFSLLSTCSQSELRKITVRVPATTANLGPGFDCIGMALDLWNEVTIEPGKFGVETEGEGAGELPSDARNLIVTGVEMAFGMASKQAPPLSYVSHNRIPHSRGLGSSSAAISWSNSLDREGRARSGVPAIACSHALLPSS